MQGLSGHYQAIEQFFAGWHTYRKLVAHNHMHHREIAAELAQRLACSWPTEAITVLDLGCGDAAQLAPALAGISVSSYTGVDLAAPALELARGHLQGLRCPVKLLRANYSGLLDALAGPYDLIHNSYSLHHLKRADKADYFRQCQRLLAPGGVHVLVDGLRLPHESHDACLGRHVAAVYERFVSLTPSEQQSMEAHMRRCDFVETEATLRGLAETAGLVGWEACFRTPLYGMFVCKSAAQAS